MNATAADSVPAMPRGRVFNAYLQEIRSEIVRYLRNPGFMLPMLAFSTVFYVSLLGLCVWYVAFAARHAFVA